MPKTALSGVYTPVSLEIPEDSGELAQQIGTGELFSGMEAVYNQDYPLRPFAIKLNNTVDFLQGKSSNTGVAMGKHQELYEYGYLWDYGMAGQKWNGNANREALRARAEKLSYIQEEFRKQGKYLYVLITPNKAAFTEDNLPDYIRESHDKSSGTAQRNIDVLKKYLEEYGIPFFDSGEYIRNELPKEVIPFYRSGIHYSWPAGYYAAREMFARIERDTGLEMPSFDLRVQEQEAVVFPNQDLFNLLNTFQEITGKTYADQPQQQVYIENLQASQTRIVMQGGSFLGPYIDMRLRYPGIFRRFDIIQNTVFLPHGEPDIQLGTIWDVDLSKLQNDQLFIFEVNETSAADMSFGFIDYLSDYLGTTGFVNVKPYALIFTDGDLLTAAMPYGIYDLGAALPWRFTGQNFGCRLENPDIFENGLLFSMVVTDDLRGSAEDGRVTVDVTVNGVSVGTYEPDAGGILRIPAEALAPAANPEGICELACEVNCAFIPNQLHPENPDSRSLALILYSITAAEGGAGS